MKKNYYCPAVEQVRCFAHGLIMAGGSIENMNYGSSNVFGDDDDEAKERENLHGNGESGWIQNSLW